MENKVKIERLRKESDKKSKILRAIRSLYDKGEATRKDVLKAYNALRNIDAEIEILLTENP